MFILNYFSCRECSKNFEKETDNWMDNLKNSTDAVLYLWRVHNSVNKRLSAEGGNDPLFPKIQFPSKIQCPECQSSNGVFDNDLVLRFLLTYYSSKKIESIAELAVIKI